jgi:hypothetical protein
MAIALLLGPAGCSRKPQTPQAEATIEEPNTLMSTVRMADPKAATQLVKGFYPPEGNAWRWTSKAFTVTLRAPADAATRGAKLVLRFAVPEPVIQRVKTVTLTAKVEGVALPAVKYEKSGDYVYTQDVPASVFKEDTVVADFALDNYLHSGDVEKRELGVIVTTAGLEAK